MYTPNALLVLAAAASVNALSFADRVAVPLARRDVSRGWAVLASSAPADSVSCGGGAYCPSSLTCFDAKNSEVASCCPDNKPCVGEVEGSPNCADGSYNMFSGIDGNGFCCQAGQVGVIDRQARTVNCVASGDVGSQSTAVLTKTGTGAAPTSSSSASASSSSATTAPTSTSSVSASSTSSASSSSSSSASSTLSQSNAGTSNGTTTSGTTLPSNTSTSAAGIKEAAMGLVAAGLMLVAAL